MLVITRKTYERVQIGPDIILTITRIDRNRVQLGIEAPRNVTIERLDPVSHPSAEDLQSE